MRNLGRAAAGALALALLSIAAPAATAPHSHILLISIDGFHALDLANHAASHPQVTLARLAKGGFVYRHAFTPLISDSFPGLAAQVTGGSPATTGVDHDDSYDRTPFPAGSACRGEPGTDVPFASEIDVDPTRGARSAARRRRSMRRSCRCKRRAGAARPSIRTTTCA